ncbi:lysophospholipid acyltransferase family protein [Ereboglobus luteus]|nr:lysophospholipid acyltransferase family protein [Ereboglobus luteus]
MSYAFHQLEMDRWYGFFLYLDAVLMDIAFRGDVYGQDNLPKRGPYMIACNHASFLDPPIVGAFLPHQVRFFARKTLWKPGFASWWLDAVGTIPVDRDGGSDVKAIKAVLQTMKDKKVVIMFPEGTRSPDGSLQTAKPGVGMFACRTGVPIVPARVFDSNKAFGTDGKLHPCTPVPVVYGKPLGPTDYDDPSKGKERYQHASDIIMSRIAELQRPNPPVI